MLMVYPQFGYSHYFVIAERVPNFNGENNSWNFPIHHREVILN